MFVNASLILLGYLLHFVDLLIIQEDEGSFCVLPCIFFIIIPCILAGTLIRNIHSSNIPVEYSSQIATNM